ncbi:MAG: hypothetical protein IIY06_00640 [Proteobacteria bacterium]|jgi:hypothetical protein|nr:hypothetical protein [Pseudomonadota bacterium]
MIDNRFIDYCISRNFFSRDRFNSIHISEEGSTYDAIINNNLANQQQLAIAAGDYYKVPVADVNQIKPDPSALAYANAALCKKLLFLPFSIDPNAGLLIAIADYINQDLVRNFMLGKGVTKMNFYVAPYNDLLRIVSLSYERPRETSGFIQLPDSLRNNSYLRKPSCNIDEIRKPSCNIDEITAFPSIPEQGQAFSKLLASVDALHADNIALRQQIDKLTQMLELETTFTRELVRNLKSNGILSDVIFERLLDILK